MCVVVRQLVLNSRQLKELDAEDIERLAAKLKKVQAKKFVKTVAALQA